MSQHTGHLSITKTDERIFQEQRDLERIIQPMLVWGVRLSAALMLVGVVSSLVLGRHLPEALPSFSQVLPQVLALDPAGFLALGLLVLIATPIARVGLSVIGFLYEGDLRYALITAGVFLIILISMVLG